MSLKEKFYVLKSPLRSSVKLSQSPIFLDNTGSCTHTSVKSPYATGETPQIEIGENKISVTVNITYEIR